MSDDILRLKCLCVGGIELFSAMVGKSSNISSLKMHSILPKALKKWGFMEHRCTHKLWSRGTSFLPFWKLPCFSLQTLGSFVSLLLRSVWADWGSSLFTSRAGDARVLSTWAAGSVLASSDAANGGSETNHFLLRRGERLGQSGSPHSNHLLSFYFFFPISSNCWIACFFGDDDNPHLQLLALRIPLPSLFTPCFCCIPPPPPSEPRL